MILMSEIPHLDNPLKSEKKITSVTDDPGIPEAGARTELESMQSTATQQTGPWRGLEARPALTGRAHRLF